MLPNASHNVLFSLVTHAIETGRYWVKVRALIPGSKIFPFQQIDLARVGGACHLHVAARTASQGFRNELSLVGNERGRGAIDTCSAFALVLGVLPLAQATELSLGIVLFWHWRDLPRCSGYSSRRCCSRRSAGSLEEKSVPLNCLHRPVPKAATSMTVIRQVSVPARGV